MATHVGSHTGLHVFLEISDTGIGMDEKLQQNIFDPFFTTKENGKGTGLGLATVLGVVKQNNGSLFVYSEPLKGSTFKIYWPATEETITEAKTDFTGEKRKLGGSETILCVEDSDDVRRALCDSLKHLGYRVYEAENGKKAAEVIHRNLNPDLLITDLVMPVMNGIELYELVSKQHPELKVLFTSGYADEVLSSEKISIDRNCFISKPFSMRDILNKVRDLLDNKND